MPRCAAEQTWRDALLMLLVVYRIKGVDQRDVQRDCFHLATKTNHPDLFDYCYL